MSLPELKRGDKVKRGPTWRWGNHQDDNGKATGTVIYVAPGHALSYKSERWINVRWDHGSEYSYRYGGPKQHQDIVPVDSRRIKENIFLEGF